MSDGTFRRRAQVATRKPDAGTIEARCAVEDDFHHFRVALTACDGVITRVQTDARRTPNNLCEAAGQQLKDLVGMELDPASASVLQQTDQFQQCTHQLDLAGLGVAAMALERTQRTYDVVIPDRVDGLTRASLLVDGQRVLEWLVSDMTVLEPYKERSLGAGFTRFTASLDRDEAEAALVMRRALFVSRGRAVDTSALGKRGPVGGCWAWQPQRIPELERQPENLRDFSDRADDLLADDREWLDFV